MEPVRRSGVPAPDTAALIPIGQERREARKCVERVVAEVAVRDRKRVLRAALAS